MSNTIQYQVLNPATNQYINTNTLSEANIALKNVEDEYCVFCNVGQAYNDLSFCANQQQIANEFIAIKTGIAETTFDYRVYNATIEENISEVFVAEDTNYFYLIKVSTEAKGQVGQTQIQCLVPLHPNKEI
jgi:hypothetical protein